MIKHVSRIMLFLWLCLATSVHAEEICEIDRVSIVQRLTNRSYPSVFSFNEHVILNEPIPENEWDWSYHKKTWSYHDLFIAGSFRSLGFQNLTDEGHLTDEGRKLVSGETVHAWYEKKEIQDLNPDFLFLLSLYYYGDYPPDSYPEDWEYWLRDEAGNRIQDLPFKEFLIDYTLPGMEDHFVKMAVSVAECGIFDGIFMDLWSERAEAAPGPDGIAHLYHGNRVEALVSLVKRIREAVGDDFLIVVNTRTEKIPRSAPYVNGAFMETWDKYPRERILEIESALSWYEENLRYPQVNNLEIAKNPSEPWDSPDNRRLARVTTTLVLTHSNGSISITGKQQNPGARYWYPFWNAPLGRSIGGDETKGVLYETPKGEEIEGLFIREFTNGWAVYNRSGKEQEIELPQAVSGWSSGVENQRRHTLADLDGEIYLKAESGLEPPPTVDVNADGVVNIQDLVIVANALGEVEPDLNGDGVVNIQDLVIVANAFRQ